MSEARMCPDCGIAMEEGIMAEFTFNRVMEILWHPKEVGPETFIWTQPGTVGFDRTKFVEIVAYRCPQCGLVRTYAIDSE